METNSPQAICCSLEWAKKLKEAGWQQDDFTSLFWWNYPVRGEDKGQWFIAERKGGYGAFASPTAEEILRKLPQQEPNCDDSADLRVFPLGWRWIVAYHEQGVGNHIMFEEDTLANAAAAMYCYLSNNKLLP